jgi:hypothetical protein
MFGASCPHLAPCGLCVKYDKPCADVLNKNHNVSPRNGGCQESHAQNIASRSDEYPLTGSTNRVGG